jgi:hypothetical protein
MSSSTGLRSIARRWPELSIVAVGIALRLSALGASPRYSYDFESHWKYIEWLRAHAQLPPCDLSRETFQPPLYYLLAAASHLPMTRVAGLSIAAGALRLLIVWLGLELYLPSRLARCVALAVVAVLPASVHLDGMVGGEALSNLFAACAILLAPRLFCEGSRRRGMLLGCALGASLAAALLTKVSSLAIVGALGASLMIDRALRRPRRTLLPWVVAAVTVALLSGWYFARNYRDEGKLFLTSFDCKEKALVVDSARRTPAFYFGGSAEIYRHPYYPSGLEPEARFFPVFLASTFVDYYNYDFSPPPAPGDAFVLVNQHPLRPPALALGIASLAGGTLIALATAAAWLWVLVAAVRARDSARILLVLVPAFALLGQLYFATRYPYDHLGHIKGSFVQFAAPPLCALFGASVAHLWRRRPAAAVVLLAALAMVAGYSIGCRLVLA